MSLFNLGLGSVDLVLELLILRFELRNVLVMTRVGATAGACVLFILNATENLLCLLIVTVLLVKVKEDMFRVPCSHPSCFTHLKSVKP